LFFGGGNGIAQLAKNRPGCLFRRPFSLVRFFLDEQKEMNNTKKKKKVSF
jgi:hypothetical protein